VIHSLVPWRPRRIARSTTIASVAVAASATLAFAGGAVAHDYRPVPPPPTNPTSADQIQNIGQVSSAIKAYYGDTPMTGSDGQQVYDPVTTDGKDVPLHTFSPDSAYVHELSGIERSAERYLAAHGDRKAHRQAARRAILLDIDDTTLNTYSYEIYANFGYNPNDNAAFVTDPSFDLPAVPGMPDLVGWAAGHGYAVFFLTGRPEGQRNGTEQDLTARGYPVVGAGDAENPDNVYLKNDSGQSWITCDTTGDKTCTTTERKSETRKHIEALGYDIVANFGDQYSDLNGGYADKTYKLPNPMYYLP
jgi:hypothetical protein